MAVCKLLLKHMSTIAATMYKLTETIIELNNQGENTNKVTQVAKHGTNLIVIVTNNLKGLKFPRLTMSYAIRIDFPKTYNERLAHDAGRTRSIKKTKV